MYPKAIQNIITLFMKFPGIGPRQAARLAIFILKSDGLTKELANALGDLEKIGFCTDCFRSIEIINSPAVSQGFLCSICRDDKREHSTIAVVEKESDMQNIEKTGIYRGLYHILGGVLSPHDQESPKKLHLKELYQRIQNTLTKKNECEVVFATNTTTESDMTALYIERILEPLSKKFSGLKIVRLGRGLALGSELEYADEITIKNALTNRK